MQISGCCRKNESSADVPPFCVPPITKSTRISQPQIDTDFHRFCNTDSVVAAFVLKRRTKKQALGTSASTIHDASSVSKCGQKMIAPITTAAIAVTSTAPAATSLASRMIGWKLGVAASAKNSKAVFSASAVQTIAIASTIQHHSDRESWKKNPSAIAATVAAR